LRILNRATGYFLNFSEKSRKINLKSFEKEQKDEIKIFRKGAGKNEINLCWFKISENKKTDNPANFQKKRK
jgi:hypothetical protein